MSSRRRDGLSATPVGHWWAGVTRTARAWLARRAVTSSPSASTGTGTTARPARTAMTSCSRGPGSSRAMTSMPDRARVARAKARPWRKPPTTTAVVGGHHLAQVTGTGWLLVPQPGGRQRSRRLTHGPDPVAQRNRAEVGDAVLEVDLERRPCCRGRRGLGAVAPLHAAEPSHPGARADRGVDVPLRHELLVDLHHRAARDAQMFGQPPGGRQPLPDEQTALTDRDAQLLLDLQREGDAGAVHGDHQVGSVAAPVGGHEAQSTKWSSESGPKWIFRADRLATSIEPWASDLSWHSQRRSPTAPPTSSEEPGRAGTPRGRW